MADHSHIEWTDALAGMAGLPPAGIDLIYIDPPFNTGVEWTGNAGTFSDLWRWDAAAERHALELGEMAPVVRGLFGRNATGAYCAFMGCVLRHAHRILKPSGLLWLHCDDHARAELRILLDLIFGARFWIGDFIWRRSSGQHNRSHTFARVHDTIILVARHRLALSLLKRFRADRLRSEIDRHGFIDVQLNQASRERVGYPTQKPVQLLEMLIAATSFRGQTVLDPMCGSGTTIVAALNLDRRAIGFDASPAAIATARSRIERRPPKQLDLLEVA